MRLAAVTGPLVALLLMMGGARAAAAGPRTLVLLHATGPAADDAALAQAVSIYTRDLDYQLVVGGDVVPEITPEGLGRVIAWVRRSGARMAFWTESHRRDEAVLYAVGIVDGRVAMNALRVAGVVGHEQQRALALKVGAVLTGQADEEKNEPLPPPKLPPEPAPPRVVYVQLPPPPATVRAPAPPPPPYRARVRLAADYRVTLPAADLGLVRHGVAVELSAPLGGVVELALGVDVATSPTRQIAAGAASLFDLPLRLGVRARLERRRVRLAGGALVSLHVLSATAIGFDGTRGDATRVAAGLGGELVAQVRLTEHMALDARALVEGLVPDEKFQLHGALALDAGGALVGLGAGLAFSAP